MTHTVFKSLKENVSETYGSMAQLIEKFDWGFFTNDASNQIQAYEVLDEAFGFSDDGNELVRYVANEISGLKQKAKDADDYEVIKYLVKYIRFNFPEELWDEYENFNLSHLHRGC